MNLAIGLTPSAMRMAFMSLDKERGETDEAFVIRAEKERVRHKETEDVCLCLFLPRTSPEF